MLQTMNARDIERVRGLANRLGVPIAADVLGISRQSLLALLAGTGVKDGTEAKVLAALQRGVTDTVRGETRANPSSVKRRS